VTVIDMAHRQLEIAFATGDLRERTMVELNRLAQ
jgi:hypothetical protein